LGEWRVSGALAVGCRLMMGSPGRRVGAHARANALQDRDFRRARSWLWEVFVGLRES
jgi:hypothetical protein